MNCRQTCGIIESGKPRDVASALTFGRQDLLPVFSQRSVDCSNVEPSVGLDDFWYYWNRRMGLDG